MIRPIEPQERAAGIIPAEDQRGFRKPPEDRKRRSRSSAGSSDEERLLQPQDPAVAPADPGPSAQASPAHEQDESNDPALGHALDLTA